MIELGLARISRLLKDTPIPWRPIHVAGTNGKGSVCAYASTMLSAGKIRCGRFTSPHLIDRWDCINIDGAAVNEGLFCEVEAVIKARDRTENIRASEFELLTATAFEIFNQAKIEVGVVEVGLGGRHDATNVLAAPSVTVITSISEDHQSFLGHTLEAIAYQKAGIMKPNVHCIVDGSNHPSTLTVLERNAAEAEAPLLVINPHDHRDGQLWSFLQKSPFEHHQQMNVCLAFEAVKALLAQNYPSVDPWPLLPAVQASTWPGRLQSLSIEALTDRVQDVLVDGAHNVQSAEILGSYVDRRLRGTIGSVTWVVAASNGKDIQELLACLVRPGDLLIAVQFGPVDGMPWISPHETRTIREAGHQLGILNQVWEGPNKLDEALRLATQIADCGPLVIAGSLYLVSDIFRLLRQAERKLA